MINLIPRYFFKNVGTNSNYEELFPLYCSIDNYFVPLFAGSSGKLLKSGVHKAIVYNLLKGNYDNDSIPYSIKRFLDMIHSGEKSYKFCDYESDQMYYGMKHFIYIMEEESVIPLYALCSTRQDIFSINQTNPDYSKFYLLIDNRLFLPRHRKFALRIKPIIKYLTELNVNIIYSNNLTKLCLNQNSEPQLFSTINDRMLFIDKLKSQLGLYGRPKPQSEQAVRVTEPTRYSGFIDALNDTWA